MDFTFLTQVWRTAAVEVPGWVQQPAAVSRRPSSKVNQLLRLHFQNQPLIFISRLLLVSSASSKHGVYGVYAQLLFHWRKLNTIYWSTDTSYHDQLGPLHERPKTSRRLMNVESDELDVGDDLLPLWIEPLIVLLIGSMPIITSIWLAKAYGAGNRWKWRWNVSCTCMTLYKFTTKKKGATESLFYLIESNNYS